MQATYLTIKIVPPMTSVKFFYYNKIKSTKYLGYVKIIFSNI